MESSEDIVRRQLVDWYRRRRRDLPWRRTRDPYRILVAEVLLQRTQVATGQPYYERFVERFPDVRSLANASEEEVLRAWEGLGFYRRARNLHAAARAIVDRHGGQVPRDAATLETLPGIGPYTAGAVASIAFGERVPAVDGNATRVLARLYRVEHDVTRGAGRTRIQDLAASIVPPTNPGEFNQALMELGATVCLPLAPRCGRCPLESSCLAHRAGVEASLPRRTRAREAPVVPVVFALLESEGRILLFRRPRGGLLAGLWSLPGAELRSRAKGSEMLVTAILDQTGVRARIGPRIARVDHTFSHRRWKGAIYRCEPIERVRLAPEARWVSREERRMLPIVPFHRKAIEVPDPVAPNP